jgi:nitrate/TMAO reductase-like tetraheme cytochrome c subunit
MFKRVTIVALVVAAFLVLAVPALAFNGMRGDYTTADGCQICHSGTAGIPAVYHEWAETKHAENEAYSEVANRVPTGSVCQGCHTSNFAPLKMTPQPTATTTAYSTPAGPAMTPTATATAYGYFTDTSPNQATGMGAWSEGYIGCSSCHYGANMAGIAELAGSDPKDTAHTSPFGEMANADICGACHSRYSYTVDTYPIIPIPTTSAIATIQPQMALGYNMLGTPKTGGGWNPAAPLSSTLNIPYQGWWDVSPTPSPAATTAGTYTAPSLMKYWKDPEGNDMPWQLIGHDGSAAQYPEWAGEGHAGALQGLTSLPFWASLPEASKQECLECHSADFRIMKEAGKTVTSADVKYGITCAGCHAPHDKGTVKGAWDEEFDAQLVGDANLAGNGSNLCTTCHNSEIPAGTTASPGADVHHPMKEMMDGYGAIDVAAFPSVHKGKCIECHMAPTSYSRGSVQLGGNHTFTIIEPEQAVEASPIPIASATARATAWPNPSASVITTTKTVTQDSMPYSACSTCHNNGQKPTPVPVATATTSANATAIAVTITQNVANQGDKALWLQDTIEQRRAWTEAKVAEIHTELNAAAVRLGYANEKAARDALVAIPAADRTADQTEFLKAYTNVQYVASEGSYGLHNWDYSRQIVTTALYQARTVEAKPAPAPWSVAFNVSKTKVKKNTKVKYSGSIAPAENLAFGKATVTIQRKQNGNWKKWKTVTCNAAGSYSLSVKMTSKGTYTLRALMPANTSKDMLEGASSTKTVKVK